MSELRDKLVSWWIEHNSRVTAFLAGSCLVLAVDDIKVNARSSLSWAFMSGIMLAATVYSKRNKQEPWLYDLVHEQPVIEPADSRPVTGEELRRLANAYDSYTPLLNRCYSMADSEAKNGHSSVRVYGRPLANLLTGRAPSDADYQAVISQLATNGIVAARVGTDDLHLEW